MYQQNNNKIYIYTLDYILTHLRKKAPKKCIQTCILNTLNMFTVSKVKADEIFSSVLNLFI